MANILGLQVRVTSPAHLPSSRVRHIAAPRAASHLGSLKPLPVVQLDGANTQQLVYTRYSAPRVFTSTYSLMVADTMRCLLFAFRFSLFTLQGREQ